MNLQTVAALADHPDRVRWNARFGQPEVAGAPFTAAAWLTAVLELGLPAGPVLELAAGRSGTALALAAQGRRVTAVDISDAALIQLHNEAARRGVADRLTSVHTDLNCWQPDDRAFALVLSRLFWDAMTFRRACQAVATGGVLAWEALAVDDADPGRNWPSWYVESGAPASHLPSDFTVVHEAEETHRGQRSRIVIARRQA